MSSTRHAADGSPLRQERFASAPEFERGLLANLVAKRAALLDDAREIALIWFLQHLSWQPGGLAKIAADILNQSSGRLGTLAMLRVGVNRGKPYSAELTFQIENELSAGRSKRDRDLESRGDRAGRLLDLEAGRITHEQFKSLRRPAKFESTPRAHDDLLRECQAQAHCLDAALAQFCLDPAFKPPPWFAGLVETLHDFHSAWLAARNTGICTAIGAAINDTLEYSLSQRCMVLLSGLPRTGKTHALKAWTARHPGQARYVSVPCGNDDISFFHAIAASLGVSINQNSKAQELRARIEDTLHAGQLGLLLDEGANLWPQSSYGYRYTEPPRIKWLMGLADAGVPIAIGATPQFHRTQKAIEAHSHWRAEQFNGRIALYTPLPDKLVEADLAAIARALLPEACAKSVKALVAYAQASDKYLAGIESAARRARHTAVKAGRNEVIFADIRAAIQGTMLPSDSALERALADAPRGRRRQPAPLPPPERGALADAPPLDRNRTHLSASAERQAEDTLAANRLTASDPDALDAAA